MANCTEFRYRWLKALHKKYPECSVVPSVNPNTRRMFISQVSCSEKHFFTRLNCQPTAYSRGKVTPSGLPFVPSVFGPRELALSW